LLVARAPVRHRVLTIVGDPAGLGSALSRRLAARGDAVTCHPVADSALPSTGDVIYLGAAELASAPPDDPATLRSTHELAGTTPLNLLAQLARRDTPGRAWLVTLGVHPLHNTVSASAAFQAPLLGIGRVFALEHPELWGGLVDLPAAGSCEALAEALLAAIDGADAEDQLAFRDGGWMVPRLVRKAPPMQPPIAFRSDATYLVTGGFGGLGAVVARWMVERGARHLALVGRNVPKDTSLQRELEAHGATVLALSGDVGDESSMAAVLGRVEAQGPALRGIIHAAADLTSAPIRELSATQIDSMLRPKLDGTVVLDKLTRGRPLDFLALFSSTTALLGASGLAHYAAANAFLDAFAAAANAPGRRVLSVNWGTWEVMRLASTENQRSYRASGLDPMPVADALDALARLLAGTASQAVVAQINWSILKPLHESRRPRPLLEKLGTGAVPQRPPGPGRGSSLAEHLAGVPAADRHDHIFRLVSTEVAGVLGRDPTDPIPPAVGLFDLGMDSLMSVELRRRLERGVGRSLPSTLTFNYSNVDALTGYLEAEFASSPASAAPVAVAAVQTPPVAAGGDLAELSDDELEARLMERLERIR
jgi:NAD(P)-dependent dehydrogenase (short-subunit alcohol dehydrogenase family)/acyl carrier protein